MNTASRPSSWSRFPSPRRGTTCRPCCVTRTYTGACTAAPPSNHSVELKLPRGAGIPAGNARILAGAWLHLILVARTEDSSSKIFELNLSCFQLFGALACPPRTDPHATFELGKEVCARRKLPNRSEEHTSELQSLR